MLLQMIALFFALVFIAPITQGAVNSVAPSLGRLLSNLSTITAAFAFMQLQLHAAHDDSQELTRRRYPRLAIFGLVQLSLIGTFFAATRPTGLGLFTYQGAPLLRLYALIYSLYLTWALLVLLWLAGKSALNTRGSLRLGMMVLATGYVLGVAYAAGKIEYVVRVALGVASRDAPCTGGPFSGYVCTMAVGLPALSVMVIVVGLMIYPLSKGIPLLVQDLQQLHEVGFITYWRLRSLWATLRDAMPQIEYTPPQADESIDRGPSRSHDDPLRWLAVFLFRVYRRVVEVQDGALLLDPYRRESDTAEHHERGIRAGLRSTQLSAAVEAADLASALKRYTDGRGEHVSSSRTRVRRDRHSDNLEREAKWLALVSRAFEAEWIPPVKDEASSLR